MSKFTYPEGGPPADLFIEGRGSSIGEAVASVALGMYNSITPLEGIEERDSFEAEVDGIDLHSLLFNVLDELLFLNDSEGWVAKNIGVEIDETNLKARMRGRGERFSAKTHQVGIAVKAVTYHLMSVEKKETDWVVRVVFDT